MESSNDDNEMEMIYLDNNATTFLDRSVISTMIDHLKCSHRFGNASSSHLFGKRSRELIEECREDVRKCINAKYADEIVFTSGGTESNNLALNGICQSDCKEIEHIITSPFEHPSVQNILQHLQSSRSNIEISFVRVNSDGIVDVEHLRQLIRRETKLVSIMHSNNEIGSIEPIEEIVRLCRELGSADLIVHSDASQSIGKVTIDVSTLGIDLLTICSHKFHGPKGIGALYIRRGIKLNKSIYGAEHEKGLRPGTENVLAIVGLGKACRLISNQFLLNQRIEQMRRTRDRLSQGLFQQFQGQNILSKNGNDETLPNTLSLTVRGINAKQLIDQLKDRLAFSSGSACHQSSQQISTTLQAIGVSFELCRSTIRLSTSFLTTDYEIDKAISILTNAIEQQLSSN